MLIVITAASGSPGVTTSALGLASVWPRPVILVDADPTGSSAIPAGYFHGAQLPTSSTIVDAAVAHRDGVLAESLAGMLMPIPGTNAQFLAGAVHHAQARGLVALWEPLAGLLRGLDQQTGQDAIVDAGRLGLDGYPTALLQHADRVLLATRSTLPALVGASSWAETLRELAPETTRILLIGQGMPYGTREVGNALDLPIAAILAHDPASAEVYSRGASPARRFATSNLNKSLAAAAAALRTTGSTS